MGHVSVRMKTPPAYPVARVAARTCKSERTRAMTRVINFGSLNTDHVYAVKELPKPGETVTCGNYQRFAGGKGLNQSIALAHGGAHVFHAGKICVADIWLKSLLEAHAVDTRYVATTECPGGHAIICVNDAGENSIVIFGGANQTVTEANVRGILAEFGSGDYLLVQNEVSCVPDIIRVAQERGLKIVFNPAPMEPQVATYPLDLVDVLIVNESEGQALSGEQEPRDIAEALYQNHPTSCVIVTMGESGAALRDVEGYLHQRSPRVQAVDTTAAGDTFIGFFLAELIQTQDAAAALECACCAAAVCVTRRGAAPSIPRRNDIAGSASSRRP